MTANSAGRLLVDDDDPPPPARECPLVAVLRRRGETVVALTGELDISNEESLLAIVEQALSASDTNLVLDLGGVQYMSASTIHIIERTRECLARGSRSLTLRSPSPIARRLLDICSLDHRAQPMQAPRRLHDPI